MTLLRRVFLRSYDLSYRLIRPFIFRQSPQEAHEQVMRWLSRGDSRSLISRLARFTHRRSFETKPVTVGGVTLPHPFILAAGFVKGHGFEDETRALQAVQNGENIIPGWKVMPQLVGLVEFGSFTRHPRLGNSGTVMWRDKATQSTQNRVGLKNAGVIASAEFLCQQWNELPPQFGINIALSPGVDDLDQNVRDVRESLNAFLERGVIPTWFTLNISCPNTDDDPSGNQTATLTHRLCEVAIQQIGDIPLWVKISPDLAKEQVAILVRVFAETGVRAVVATNTLAQLTPDNPELQGGVGGGKLYAEALKTVQWIQEEKSEHRYTVDVIGCGGVLDKASYHAYRQLGVEVVQYWSAMVYRGPLAGALIESESS